MKSLVAFLIVWLQIEATAEILFGCSYRTVIGNTEQFDSEQWSTPPLLAVQTTTIPNQNVQLNFKEGTIYKGAYCYIFVLQSQVAGSFYNGNFRLNPSDFASNADGFFKVDASGYPCVFIEGPNRKTWREYRLLNQPFAPITVTVTP